MTSIKDIIGKEILFFDGGTGSLLQAQGLIPGELPETWNVTHKEEIIILHYNYFRSGANIIKTNTFGANSLKFPVGKAFTKEGFALKKSSQQEQHLATGCGCGCH
ncbi:MAG: homocysteine S-methyltransferase family protein, partial [Spirochaetaceae bacterium]|nr:homocysteine S-methyltransferase family protein [Spirochaetaceae bacterium]